MWGSTFETGLSDICGIIFLKKKYLKGGNQKQERSDMKVSHDNTRNCI